MAKKTKTTGKQMTNKTNTTKQQPTLIEKPGVPLKLLKEPQPMLYQTLHRALSAKRPHGGQGVFDFCLWLLKNLPDGVHPVIDKCGNIHIDNRRDTDRNKTLFTAHVDTVHRTDGKNLIRTDGKFWYADEDVLGADDGVGVALLMHMLTANVPAYYLFTQGEERGGIGAKHVADNYAAVLRGFDRAVAFDRRGIDSIITHQGYGRCCSDDFANALADQLNLTSEEMFYLPDDTGIYTDTAEFVEFIPECTNISCGYYSEHTQAERLDLAHFNRLAQACLTIDWDALPTKRDPSKFEEKEWGYGSLYTTAKTSTKYACGSSQYSNISDYWDDKEYLYNDFDDARDEKYYRIRAIDALLDATQGYTDDLADMMAEAAYPDDINLARKHLRMASLDRDTLEYALNGVEDGFDVDSVLLDLFDIAHTH